MDTQSIRKYLDILRNPSVPTDKEGKINPLEFNSFKEELENIRIGFILAISEIEKNQSIDFILQELVQAKETITKRGFTSVNTNDVLDGIMAGHSEFEPFYQIQIIDKMLLDSVEKTLSIFKVKSSVNPESTKESTAQVETRLQKTLSQYPALLTVNDITQIFGVTSRTVSNWEKDGTLVNVSNVSEETNSNGHRKRSKEKRYKKEDVQHNLFLNEKYNSTS